MIRFAYTTGQAATTCGISATQIVKCCESGELPFFFIPNSTHRRIGRGHLIAFMQRHGMPLRELAGYAESTPTNGKA